MHVLAAKRAHASRVRVLPPDVVRHSGLVRTAIRDEAFYLQLLNPMNDLISVYAEAQSQVSIWFPG